MPQQPVGSPDQSPPDFGKIGSDLRDAGSKMGNAALGKAEELAGSGLKSGIDQVHAVTEAATRAAEDLQQQVPLIADYVRDAAQNIDRMSQALRDKSVGELLTTATEYGRKQPVLFFAGAAVIGFALTRFVRTGMAAHAASSAASSGPEERDAVVKSTGLDV
jgi:hypothetical protein